MSDIAAITSVTVVSRTVFGNKRVVMGYLTWGNGTDTVPAAGLALTPASLGLEAIDLILFETKSAALSYDYTNAVIKDAGSGVSDGLLFNVSGGALVPASGETVRFLAIGYGG